MLILLLLFMLVLLLVFIIVILALPRSLRMPRSRTGPKVSPTASCDVVRPKWGKWYRTSLISQHERIIYPNVQWEINVQKSLMLRESFTPMFSLLNVQKSLIDHFDGGFWTLGRLNPKPLVSLLTWPILEDFLLHLPRFRIPLNHELRELQLGRSDVQTSWDLAKHDKTCGFVWE